MIVSSQSAVSISKSERALLYGDGCFTTMSVSNGYIELWDMHLARLKYSCERLFIHFKHWEALTAAAFSEAGSVESGVLKILISRGEGGRGYDIKGVTNCKAIITKHSMPQHYSRWRREGIRLSVSEVTLARQPLLAGIKHLNRLEQVLIKHQMSEMDCDDVLVCDDSGAVIETSVGNLLWRKNTDWFTPKLDKCGVDGVMRNHVMNYFNEKNINIEQVDSDISSITSADEMIICNSLMKVIPVAQLFVPEMQKTIHYSMQECPQIQKWLKHSLAGHHAS